MSSFAGSSSFGSSREKTSKKKLSKRESDESLISGKKVEKEFSKEDKFRAWDVLRAFDSFRKPSVKKGDVFLLEKLHRIRLLNWAKKVRQRLQNNEIARLLHSGIEIDELCQPPASFEKSVDGDSSDSEVSSDAYDSDSSGPASDDDDEQTSTDDGLKGMGGIFKKGGIKNMMNGMVDAVYSKALLEPTSQAVVEQLPPWLETHKGTLLPATLDKYERSLDIYKEILQVCAKDIPENDKVAEAQQKKELVRLGNKLQVLKIELPEEVTAAVQANADVGAMAEQMMQSFMAPMTNLAATKEGEDPECCVM